MQRSTDEDSVQNCWKIYGKSVWVQLEAMFLAQAWEVVLIAVGCSLRLSLVQLQLEVQFEVWLGGKRSHARCNR